MGCQSDRRVVLFSILAAVAGAARPSAAPYTSPLPAYRWKYRPVLVFAPDPGHPDLARQREIFKASEAGLEDRDVIVIEIVGDTVSVAGRTDASLDAIALREAYLVDADAFSVLLVGKDGGEKYRRASGAVPAQRLFDLIDRMPMRRQELRERG